MQSADIDKEENKRKQQEPRSAEKSIKSLKQALSQRDKEKDSWTRAHDDAMDTYETDSKPERIASDDAHEVHGRARNRTCPLLEALTRDTVFDVLVRCKATSIARLGLTCRESAFLLLCQRDMCHLVYVNRFNGTRCNSKSAHWHKGDESPGGGGGDDVSGQGRWFDSVLKTDARAHMCLGRFAFGIGADASEHGGHMTHDALQQVDDDDDDEDDDDDDDEVCRLQAYHTVDTRRWPFPPKGHSHAEGMLPAVARCMLRSGVHSHAWKRERRRVREEPRGNGGLYDVSLYSEPACQMAWPCENGDGQHADKEPSQDGAMDRVIEQAADAFFAECNRSRKCWTLEQLPRAPRQSPPPTDASHGARSVCKAVWFATCSDDFDRHRLMHGDKVATARGIYTARAIYACRKWNAWVCAHVPSALYESIHPIVSLALSEQLEVLASVYDEKKKRKKRAKTPEARANADRTPLLVMDRVRRCDGIDDTWEGARPGVYVHTPNETDGKKTGADDDDNIVIQCGLIRRCGPQALHAKRGDTIHLDGPGFQMVMSTQSSYDQFRSCGYSMRQAWSTTIDCIWSSRWKASSVADGRLDGRDVECDHLTDIVADGGVTNKSDPFCHGSADRCCALSSDERVNAKRQHDARGEEVDERTHRTHLTLPYCGMNPSSPQPGQQQSDQQPGQQQPDQQPGQQQPDQQPGQQHHQGGAEGGGGGGNDGNDKPRIVVRHAPSRVGRRFVTTYPILLDDGSDHRRRQTFHSRLADLLCEVDFADASALDFYMDNRPGHATRVAIIMHRSTEKRTEITHSVASGACALSLREEQQARRRRHGLESGCPSGVPSGSIGSTRCLAWRSIHFTRGSVTLLPRSPVRCAHAYGPHEKEDDMIRRLMLLPRDPRYAGHTDRADRSPTGAHLGLSATGIMAADERRKHDMIVLAPERSQSRRFPSPATTAAAKPWASVGDAGADGRITVIAAGRDSSDVQRDSAVGVYVDGRCIHKTIENADPSISLTYTLSIDDWASHHPARPFWIVYNKHRSMTIPRLTPYMCTIHVTPWHVLRFEDLAREDLAREDQAREDLAREDLAHEDLAREDLARKDTAGNQRAGCVDCPSCVMRDPVNRWTVLLPDGISVACESRSLCDNALRWAYDKGLSDFGKAGVGARLLSPMKARVSFLPPPRDSNAMEVCAAAEHRKDDPMCTRAQPPDHVVVVADAKPLPDLSHDHAAQLRQRITQAVRCFNMQSQVNLKAPHMAQAVNGMLPQADKHDVVNFLVNALASPAARFHVSLPSSLVPSSSSSSSSLTNPSRSHLAPGCVLESDRVCLTVDLAQAFLAYDDGRHVRTLEQLVAAMAF